MFKLYQYQQQMPVVLDEQPKNLHSSTLSDIDQRFIDLDTDTYTELQITLPSL